MNIDDIIATVDVIAFVCAHEQMRAHREKTLAHQISIDSNNSTAKLIALSTPMMALVTQNSVRFDGAVFCARNYYRISVNG